MWEGGDVVDGSGMDMEALRGVESHMCGRVISDEEEAEEEEDSVIIILRKTTLELRCKRACEIPPFSFLAI